MATRTRRISTRLRCEAGQPLYQEGDTFIGQSFFADTRYVVTVHRIKRQFEHPDEPGVTLMDAIVSQREITA